MRRLLIPAVIAAAAVAGAWWFAEPIGDLLTGANATDAQEHGKKTKAKGKGRGKGKEKAADVPVDEVLPPAPLAFATGPMVPATTPATPPNVVLVMGCTVRRDQMTPYGGPENTTPFLAEMARKGSFFEDTIAAAPWTRAASTAILTGKHAVSIGMVEPGPGRDDRVLPPSVVTLAERMRERGYFTIGTTANPNLNALFGFDQGYEVYTPAGAAQWGGKHAGSGVADAVLDALAANRDGGDKRPFYLRIMMLDAHGPRKVSADRIPEFSGDSVPERAAEYRASLRDFDDAVGHLWGRLNQMGFDLSNTVFVQVADHGEGLNWPAHHGFAHGQYLYPSTVSVPWIAAGPGVAAGHKVAGLSSQVDILPTLLGVVGRPLEDAGASDGHDWSAQLRGEASETTVEAVFSDTWFQQSNRAAIYTRTRQCQLDFGSASRQVKKGKFVPGCFDREADRFFQAPIEDAELTARLETWRVARTAELAGATVTSAEVSEDLSEQLKLLGYQE
jgi:hypothetical protein